MQNCVEQGKGCIEALEKSESSPTNLFDIIQYSCNITRAMKSAKNSGHPISFPKDLDLNNTVMNLLAFHKGEEKENVATSQEDSSSSESESAVDDDDDEDDDDEDDDDEEDGSQANDWD
mmetsp:Transcript_9359/g.16023  ORF Transcript_9359/g.16023 Transcript_9359/m.16023 type:complete len:119 (-) Transcript_9359:26-382(-)